MALILRELLKGYRYFNDEISDPRMNGYPLLSNPLPLMALISSYIYIVKHAGPRYMEHRKPFKIERVVQVYNIIQIILSVWIFICAIRAGWFTTFSWRCEPVDFSDNPEAISVSKKVYAFFMIKITDLLDTVFFVMRKKFNQISYLHVFHHSGMLIVGYLGSKYLPGGHSTFLGLVNSFVHAVMYSYYLLTSIYPEQKKNIWWKKHITQMQMVQFLAISLHMGQLFFIECDYPMIIPSLVTPAALYMFYLFYDFYKIAYSAEKIQKNE